MLAAAVRASADLVYIEPMPMTDDSYVVTFERESRVIATSSMDAHTATAMIARFAYIAELDLAAGHASSGVVPVRSGTMRADVVITVRPGAALRAELMVVSHKRKPAPVTMSPKGPAPNDTIGQFRVIERLGEGGMGTVFSVEHLALGRRYALKVLRAKVIEREPTAAQRFLREAP